MAKPLDPERPPAHGLRGDGLAFPRSRAFDRDYWLMRCEGYRVQAGDARAGVVDEVRFGSRLDRPDLLAVRTGRLVRRVVLVPVEEVEEIDPHARLVRVRSLSGR